MQLKVAGFNIDSDLIGQINQLTQAFQLGEQKDHILELLEKLAGETLTPETISAAYARISRSPMTVAELRRDARASVSRARQSNENIVFGLGHSSVAEHAVFNLDITEASRLALEEIESHRLASYTESSQRYLKMSGEFTIPVEVIKLGLADEFKRFGDGLFAEYGALLEGFEELFADLDKRDRRTRAREDARYILPLACLGQVGVTVNARTAEWMVKRFCESQLAEVRELGSIAARELRRITPSLVRYVDPDEERIKIDAELNRSLRRSRGRKPAKVVSSDVELISYPEDDERQTTAALLFRHSGNAWSDCLKEVDGMSTEAKRKLLVKALGFLKSHDPLLREFELGYFTFCITLSASAFAQLKRHRLSTLIPQPYQPELGFTTPQSIVESGSVEKFEQCIKSSEAMYEKILESGGRDAQVIAQYALSNAHRRRVIFQVNARELTHFSRLREDAHAQWDIRNIAHQAVAAARKVCPTLTLFTAGKDGFSEVEKLLRGGEDGG